MTIDNCKFQIAERTRTWAPKFAIGNTQLSICNFFLIFIFALAATPARAQEMVGVGIDEKLSGRLPLDAPFTDHQGRAVKLGDYFGDGKPVVLSLVYYRCPGVCTATLTGLAQAIGESELSLGEKYRVVTVSFNPQETHDLAATKRQNYLEGLDVQGDAEGWVYLTGDASSIERLTKAVGFKYRWVEATGEYAHDSAAIIATPDGRISRYLRGSFYEAETFRLSLVEASDGRIGSLSDKVWVKICGYDPRQGKYVVMAQTVLMIGGMLTILAVASVVGLLFYREQQLRKRAPVRDVQPHAA